MVGRRRRAGTSPFSLWSDAMLAGAATFTTLSVRLPQLMTGTMTRAESARMIDEKLAAATEGLLDASKVGLRVARRGAAMTPRRILQDALDVSAAAARPAQRRVKANAKRLMGPKGPH